MTTIWPKIKRSLPESINGQRNISNWIVLYGLVMRACVYLCVYFVYKCAHLVLYVCALVYQVVKLLSSILIF